MTCAPGSRRRRARRRATNQAPEPLSCAIAAATERCDRRDDRGQEREAEHLHDDRDGDDVRGTVTSEIWWNWNHVTGRVASPQARGHADQLREPVRHGIALERPHDARRDDEDRGHRGERELEAGVEERVRIPREQEHGAPTSSACQRSRWRAASQASEPSPAARAARTTDGWSPTASAYAGTVSSAAGCAA